MTEYYLYGKIGFDHIVDWAAMDHILFLLALMASVAWKNHKALLALITAFTLGHSITLFAGTFYWLKIPSLLVEFLIPLTIVISAVLNLWKPVDDDKGINLHRYLLVLFFGFIHGMGFAGDLRSLLAKTDSILIPLLSMNIGLELGQIYIITFCWGISHLLVSFTPLHDQKRRQYLSLIALVGGLFFTLLHLPINR